jgi:hypothetical protein
MAEKIEDGYSYITPEILALGDQIAFSYIETKVPTSGTVVGVNILERYFDLQNLSRVGQIETVTKVEFDQVLRLRRRG